MAEFAVLKAKSTKKCAIKRKRKSEDYKHYLEASQLENKKSQLEKNDLNVDCLRDHKKQ